jgi:beta-galactosidase
VSRRVFLRTATAGVTAWSLLGCGRPDAGTQQGTVGLAGASGSVKRGPASQTVSFDGDWLFGPNAAGSDHPGYDDSALETVTLPHTVTPLSWDNWNPLTWERTWVYRKHFDAPANTDGLRLFLDFQAAMTQSTVTLNGTAITTYTGGYLPFSAEITGHLRPTDNVVAVTLDASFNLNVPPDRPAPARSTDIDFWQPGGIYRDVQIRAVPQMFLADVFARPANVLDPASRQVVVQATVDAALVPADAVTVTVELHDPDNTRKGPLASARARAKVTRAGQATVTVTLRDLPAITLWDQDNPKLYTVVTTLSVGGEPLHDHQTRIGFREAVFRRDGFYLNGNRVKLFGLNRHQFFPYAGGAMPERVQARDAYILRKELNCNAVRCSHYPQSEAFYEAADELGLMVWEEMPGWHYFGDDAWRAAAHRDLQAMIIRDRNHPSVIIWGSMPNESGEHFPEYTLYNDLAHRLDPSRQTGGDDFSLTHGQYVFDVFSRHDYSTVENWAAGGREPSLAPPEDAWGKPYLVCEAIGALSGPAKYYRRYDTQAVQQGQAWAHAIVQNISYSNDAYCGLLAWSGFDYPSGKGRQYQGVKYTGVVDLFRVPKPGAAIYQAQVHPSVEKVIAPAFYWDFGPASPVTSLPSAMICSNLDELKVYVGGDLLTTVTPDTANYGSLPYAPSFVDFNFVDGSTLPELRIDGYLAGVKVASRTFDADPSHDKLSLEADDLEINGNGSDATRVAVRAVDRYGNARPYVDGLVTLSINGPAVLVGDNSLDFGATGGAGAVWIRSISGSPGLVTVRASHPALGAATAAIRVAEVAGAGAPVPYAAVSVAATPTVVVPGKAAAVTATVKNSGLPPLDDLTLKIMLPVGWTAVARTPVSFKGVRSGAEVTATWTIRLPPDTGRGQVPLRVQAVYTAGQQRGVTHATAEVQTFYPTLAAAMRKSRKPSRRRR